MPVSSNANGRRLSPITWLSSRGSLTTRMSSLPPTLRCTTVPSISTCKKQLHQYTYSCSSFLLPILHPPTPLQDCRSINANRLEKQNKTKLVRAPFSTWALKRSIKRDYSRRTTRNGNRYRTTVSACSMLAPFYLCWWWLMMMIIISFVYVYELRLLTTDYWLMRTWMDNANSGAPVVPDGRQRGARDPW